MKISTPPPVRPYSALKFARISLNSPMVSTDGRALPGNHTAAFDTRGSDAVHQDFLAAARRPADLRIPGVAGYTGREKDELFQVAHVAADEQRQIDQLLVLHDRAEIGCGRLQRGSIRRDFDNLLELAELERGIDGECLRNVELDILPDELPEAFCLDGQFVVADGELLQHVIAGFVCVRAVYDARAGIGGGNRRACDGGAGPSNTRPVMVPNVVCAGAAMPARPICRFHGKSSDSCTPLTQYPEHTLAAAGRQGPRVRMRENIRWGTTRPTQAFAFAEGTMTTMRRNVLLAIAAFAFADAQSCSSVPFCGVITRTLLTYSLVRQISPPMSAGYVNGGALPIVRPLKYSTPVGHRPSRAAALSRGGTLHRGHVVRSLLLF